MVVQLTLSVLNKMAYILQTHSEVFLFAENMGILIEISQKFVPEGPVGNYWCIGSGNGLSPARCQAIAWTNDNQLFGQICVVTGFLLARNWFSRRHLQIDGLVQEKEETPLLAHCSYVFRALTNRNDVP